jgi:acyl-coenzyme A synthetase/AMP-(fatty) acid ligase
VPKAFVVRSKDFEDKSNLEAAKEICEHVEKHKARYKWLAGGIEFIDMIPKSPTGKILRRVLREKERKAQSRKGRL